MKKRLIALALSSLFTLSSEAQTLQTSKAKGGPYVRVGLGYAFAHAGNTLADETISAGTYSFEVQKSSFGTGLNTAIGFGYWFSKNIGVELAANIGVAPKKYEFTITEGAGGRSNTTAINYTQYAKTPIYLMPSFLLKAGSDQMDIYTRMGLAINVAGKVITEREESISNAAAYTKDELKFRSSIGFQGALGALFAASNKVSIFLELNGISMNQYLKSGEITEFTINGEDYLDRLTTANKQVEFETEGSGSSTPNPNVPTQEPTFSLPFSNIGFAAGITIGF